MISVVTPTLHRPKEVEELLRNLAEQELVPGEVIIVDGADPSETTTEEIVRAAAADAPFDLRYLRAPKGTAVQRNAGIEEARGDLIAFIDDDVRLTPGFLRVMVREFDRPDADRVGGIVGYRTNVHFTPREHSRWRWYKRLRLFTTYEPGRYDFQTGYPINNNLQPPFSGTRPVDFMTTACAVWRRAVLDEGLRFDGFFRDYGVLEDAHFALRAGRKWDLLQCGDARCEELHSSGGRVDQVKIGYKSVVNYWYVFQSIAGPLSLVQRLRFWRFQAFELLRVAASAVRRRRRVDVDNLRGRVQGIRAVLGGAARPEGAGGPHQAVR